MTSTRVVAWLLSAVALLAAYSSTSEARRVALVVRINAYDNLPVGQQLERAVADARAMAAALKELQFTVIPLENATRDAFFAAWSRFLGEIAPGDTVAFFFAGHAIEIRGQNFLLGRDVPPSDRGEIVLKSRAIALNELLDGLDERRAAVAVTIIDACRDNPYSATSRTIGGTRGLARVEERAGTLILYSAGIGQRALDHVPGQSRIDNSVFTHTLLPLMKQPGLTLLDGKRFTAQTLTASGAALA